MIYTEYFAVEALVDFVSDRIVGRSSKARPFAVLQICLDLGGGRELLARQTVTIEHRLGADKLMKNARAAQHWPIAVHDPQ